MNSVLYGYSVSGATWLYLSALLIIGVYFRFNRLWSRRNLDLILLLALSPGLLLIRVTTEVGDGGAQARGVGYGLLLAVSALMLVRVLVDPFGRWRPRFDQNMNSAGMTWLACCALIFMGTRAIIDQIPAETESTVERAEQIVAAQATPSAVPDPFRPATGPTAPLVAAPLQMMFASLTPPILAIASHVAVLIGLLLISRKLFDDLQSGVAMAALYLLLPCTAFDVGAVNHVLPGAFLLWAVAMHRRPVVSGILVALACGALVFPLFVVPLWIGYYGRAGWKRFMTGFVASAAVLLASFALTSADAQQFVEQTTGTMRWYRSVLQSPVFEATAEAPLVRATDPTVFWDPASYWEPYRLPVITLSVLMTIIMTVWPRPKTLELLIAQQTATIIAVEFWQPDRACSYVLWYLPLLLVLMFRPRLPGVFDASEATATRIRSRPGLPPTRLAQPFSKLR